MFFKCPHCSTRVLPTSDGLCPACRKKVQDWAQKDPTGQPLDSVRPVDTEKQAGKRSVVFDWPPVRPVDTAKQPAPGYGTAPPAWAPVRVTPDEYRPTGPPAELAGRIPGLSLPGPNLLPLPRAAGSMERSTMS